MVNPHLLRAPAPKARQPTHGHGGGLQLVLSHRRRRLHQRRRVLDGPLARGHADAEAGGECALRAGPRRSHWSSGLLSSARNAGACSASASAEELLATSEIRRAGLGAEWFSPSLREAAEFAVAAGRVACWRGSVSACRGFGRRGRASESRRGRGEEYKRRGREGRERER